MADRRPLLSGMDDDYGSYALSQKASFERTFPTVMDAALAFADEPVLRVVDQGASDGRNSHALMRDLIALRAGRPLAYSFVDMPTNPWDVAHGRLNADPVIGPAVHVVPTPADARAVDAGSGGHLASADDHAAAVDEALASGATTVIGMAGIPLHTGLSAPAGTVHMAITGTTMHWVEAPQDLGSARSVFPGYPDHHDEVERLARLEGEPEGREVGRRCAAVGSAGAPSRRGTRAGGLVYRRASGVGNAVPRSHGPVCGDRARHECSAG